MATQRDPFKLVLDRKELDKLLESEHGPVAEMIAKKAQRVAGAAKRRAPKRTGALRKSIKFEVKHDEEGVYADVGSELFYAGFVENGHPIAGKGGFVSARRFLRPALQAIKGRR